MYKGQAIKTSPCTANFNDLLKWSKSKYVSSGKIIVKIKPQNGCSDPLQRVDPTVLPNKVM
jgi:hypothetical protein